MKLQRSEVEFLVALLLFSARAELLGRQSAGAGPNSFSHGAVVAAIWRQMIGNQRSGGVPATYDDAGVVAYALGVGLARRTGSPFIEGDRQRSQW